MNRFEGQGSEKREAWKENDLIVQEFLHLTPDGYFALQNRIERVRGHIRIAVHPLYLEKNPKSFKSSTKKMEDVRSFLKDGFIRTVKSVHENHDSAPLVVFEEKNGIEELKRYIAEIIGEISPRNLAELGFLIYPTENSSGAVSEEHASRALEVLGGISPQLSYNLLRLKLDSILKEMKPLQNVIIGNNNLPKDVLKSYDSLRGEYVRVKDILEGRVMRVFKAVVGGLRIHSAVVSGAYFFKPLRPNVGGTLSGCAGSVVEKLKSEGVRIDISKFSQESRDELEVAGYETKQTRK